MSKTFIELIQNKNKVADRRHCEAILDYLLRIFGFILNECDGHFINPKDEKRISNYLNFIAERGEDKYIMKTYILLRAVVLHAQRSLQPGPDQDRFDAISHKFYNLRPTQCKKVHELAAQTFTSFSASS